MRHRTRPFVYLVLVATLLLTGSPSSNAVGGNKLSADADPVSVSGDDAANRIGEMENPKGISEAGDVATGGVASYEETEGDGTENESGTQGRSDEMVGEQRDGQNRGGGGQFGQRQLRFGIGQIWFGIIELTTIYAGVDNSNDSLTRRVGIPLSTNTNRKCKQ